eukprot:CAMPEP_0194362404 /NCGR_PEP_ID=MMETSP0174-20130528/10146_1 /TAXON_ID=216777 /ORGANISM="Proboscia alata, Strain PI-D3" /LENGTH=828 /DNA_ID=CAMNT_0039135249 /DNA_START=209 /DNA_END=2695 /DNA_ORIENTATION=+
MMCDRESSSLSSAPAYKMWRIRATIHTSGWMWDVHMLDFYDSKGMMINSTIASPLWSGSASDEEHDNIPGYEAHLALSRSIGEHAGFWGGRKDDDGELWIGASWAEPVNLSKISIQTGHVESAVVECSNDGMVWLNLGDTKLLPDDNQIQEISEVASSVAAMRTPDGDNLIKYLESQENLYQPIEIEELSMLVSKVSWQIETTLSDQGLTPVHLVAFNRHTELDSFIAIFELLKTVVSLDIRDIHQRTPLVFAARHHRLISVEAIIKVHLGANKWNELALDLPKIVAPSRHLGEWLVGAVLNMNEYQLAEELKKNENIENVNKLNPKNNGNSIITQAIYQGPQTLGKIKVLVDHGADINLGALKTGDTALHMRFAEAECVDELIKIGANPSIENYAGETPLIQLVNKPNKSCYDNEKLEKLESYLRPFEEVEALITKFRQGHSDLPMFVEDFLNLAFGTTVEKKIFGKDRNGGKIVIAFDRVMVRYQILRASDDEEMLRRGKLFANLVLDLIALSGKKELRKPDKALSFYLLLQLVQQYMPAEFNSAADQALAALEKDFDRIYRNLKLLPVLTSEAKQTYGKLHQYEAHGNDAVEWISSEKGAMNTIDAAVALFENKTVEDVESFCLMVADLENEEVGKEFNLMAYRKWILGEASGANTLFQQTIKDLIPTYAIVTPGPVKEEARVITKELDYSSLKDEVENGMVETFVLLGKLRESALTSVEDRISSGGVCDFVRCSVVCFHEEQLIECYNALKQAPEEEFFLSREKNGFHNTSRSVGGYRDIKLNLMLKGSKHPHICEVQLILDSMLKLKMQSHMPYAVSRGDYCT